MRAKVLCMYPPTQLMETEMPRTDGSLGLLYLAGALRRAGIDVDVVDATVGTLHDKLEDTFYNSVMQENGLVRIGLSAGRIEEVIASGGYNVVCIPSIFTPQTKMAQDVARIAKSVSSDILVLAGGVNAKSLAGRFFAAGVDIICNTEGEKVVVNLVRAFEAGLPLEVPGTIFMRDGKMVTLPIADGDVYTNLDELPFPAWDLLPFLHYDVVNSAGRGFLKAPVRSTAMMTSRGCPFRCSYCHISSLKLQKGEMGDIGRYRLKSEARVLEELRVLKGLGVGKVFLEDDSLLAKKDRVRRIFTRVQELGIQLADVNGVNLAHFLKNPQDGSGRLVIDEELLEILCGAGLREVVFPVESASQRILDKYATGKLNHGRLDVVELVQKASALGMQTPINMMVGFPDETADEMRATIELGKRLVEAGAPYCSLYIPIPFPGSQLFSTALRDGYLSADFNPDDFNWRRAVMKNTTVPPEEIERLQAWGWRYANKETYLRDRLSKSLSPRWKSGEPEE